VVFQDGTKTRIQTQLKVTSLIETACTAADNTINITRRVS
jgi:hypothetical protein